MERNKPHLLIVLLSSGMCGLNICSSVFLVDECLEVNQGGAVGGGGAGSCLWRERMSEKRREAYVLGLHVCPLHFTAARPYFPLSSSCPSFSPPLLSWQPFPGLLLFTHTHVHWPLVQSQLIACPSMLCLTSNPDLWTLLCVTESQGTSPIALHSGYHSGTEVMCINP